MRWSRLMGMRAPKTSLSTLVMAMHCLQQELRCSTKHMSILPARRVKGIARISSKVQPLPAQPVGQSFVPNGGDLVAQHATSLISHRVGEEGSRCLWWCVGHRRKM